MNEVADWNGVLKAGADGRNPSCVYELRRIAAAHGGKIANGGGADAAAICARTIDDQEWTAVEKLNRTASES
jgi:predicted homoserine dehydrogenase-like protein